MADTVEAVASVTNEERLTLLLAQERRARLELQLEVVKNQLADATKQHGAVSEQLMKKYDLKPTDEINQETGAINRK